MPLEQAGASARPFSIDTMAGGMVLSEILAAAASMDPRGTLVTRGPDWGDALLMNMFSAEWLAAQAGVIPMIDLGNGEVGVLALGAARKVIKSPDKWDMRPGLFTANASGTVGVHESDVADVQKTYLAAYGATRRAHALTYPFPTSEAPGDLAPAGVQIGQAPGVLLVIGVLGVAAMIAGAWYLATATESWIRVRNDTAIQMAKTGAIAAAARQQIAAGQQPTALAYMKDIHPTAEPGMSAGWYVAGGLAFLVVGAGVGIAVADRPARGGKRAA